MPLMSVTFIVLNNGTVVRDKQPANISFILVTFIVLNNGRVIRFGQSLNILIMFVTFTVSDNVRVVRLLQPTNIPYMFVTLEMLSKDIFFNDFKLEKEKDKLVKSPILTPEKLIKLIQNVFAPVCDPRVKLVMFGHDNIISNTGELSGNVDPVCAYF